LLFCFISTTELMEVLQASGAQQLQVGRITAALVALGYPKSYLSAMKAVTQGAQRGPVEFLDDVKEGYGPRFGTVIGLF
jgi:hypothetical protein